MIIMVLSFIIKCLLFNQVSCDQEHWLYRKPLHVSNLFQEEMLFSTFTAFSLSSYYKQSSKRWTGKFWSSNLTSPIIALVLTKVKKQPVTSAQSNNVCIEMCLSISTSILAQLYVRNFFSFQTNHWSFFKQ